MGLSLCCSLVFGSFSNFLPELPTSSGLFSSVVKVALFERCDADAFLNSLKFTDDHAAAVTYVGRVQVEKLRIAAAKFLVERCKGLNLLKVDKIKAGLVSHDVEIFDPIPLGKLLKNFWTEFKEAKGICLKVKEHFGHEAEEYAKFQKLVGDAKDLFGEKSVPVLSALDGAITRLTTQLKGCMVSWRSFTIDEEDVQQIKTKLIGNPKHCLLFPSIRTLTEVKDFIKDLLTHLDKPASVKHLEDLLADAQYQVCASALATDIYSTPHTKAKASSKLKSMRWEVPWEL